ncbi:MAG: hypothetical protein Q8K33_01780 [Cypionkella sp.]|uniref:hypothetical protein n=1 Tax=Cypionkella sp. TaxID=2811411 RepID=UPI0027309166|nr:hypothetical protein [Cypionkella sp.]MDP2047611.1 hypothetical protein [Cypionkella sp.]
MPKPKLPCGIHFCPMALRLLWPIKAVLIKDIASIYEVGIAETTRRAERIGVIDQRKRRREPKYSPAEFRKLWADETLRVRDIAQRLDMDLRCVETHAAKMKLPERRRGSPRVYAFPDDFNDMWKAGVTTREISAFVGCCHTLVSVEAGRRELPHRTRSRKAKLTMYAYQIAKAAKAERSYWEKSGMVDGRIYERKAA